MLQLLLIIPISKSLDVFAPARSYCIIISLLTMIKLKNLSKCVYTISLATCIGTAPMLLNFNLPAKANNNATHHDELYQYLSISKSTKSVQQTVASLMKIFLNNRFIIKAQIDHQKIARSQGFTIPSNMSLLVGLPSYEAPVIESNPLGSLFVPLTVVVWDQSGVTNVAYWNPQKNIGSLLDITSGDAKNAIDKMTYFLDTIVQKAINQ